MSLEIKKILVFTKKNIGLTVFTFVLTFGVYGIKIVNHAFGMDTNIYISNYPRYLIHWISIGRFGEVFLKKSLWGAYTNIYLINFLCFLLFALSSFLLCYLFSKTITSKEVKYHLYIIPSLFLTSQIFVYQFYFVLQNFEFALGMFLVVSAVILLTIETEIRWQKIIYWILSVLMAGLAISVYQSFVLFFAAITAAVLLLEIYNSFTENTEYRFTTLFKRSLPYIIVLAVSTILYFVADKIVGTILEIPRRGRALGMIVWDDLSIKEGVISLLKAMRNIVFLTSDIHSKPTYSYSILIAVILLLPIAVLFLKKRDKNRLTAFICMTTILVSGFGVVIAMGTNPLPRSMVPQYPFVAAFLLFYASLFYQRKVLKRIVLVIVLLLTFSQIKTTSNLLFSEQMTFEEDQRKMIQIDQVIKNLELENASSYKLVIIGTSPSENMFNIQGNNELVGVSMFQFGASPNLGSYDVNANVMEIMKIMGMTYQSPSREEYLDYWQNKSTLKDSPVEFGVEVIDNFIIVKVS
ncbi:glucosyltransferase domain-containing protein [Enterococcus sp. BWB1-3]|nr:glucosyltransferase domain-containing protein [Enterococcus sp. BWB1-3]